MNEVIETRTAKIWLGEDGMVRAVLSPNAQVTLADAKEHIEALVKVCEGKKRPILVDMSRTKSLDAEARAYYTVEEGPKIEQATALLVGSPVSKIIGSFALGLNKPVYPTKLFTSEDKAIEWLKGFLK